MVTILEAVCHIVIVWLLKFWIDLLLWGDFVIKHSEAVVGVNISDGLWLTRSRRSTRLNRWILTHFGRFGGGRIGFSASGGSVRPPLADQTGLRFRSELQQRLASASFALSSSFSSFLGFQAIVCLFILYSCRISNRLVLLKIFIFYLIVGFMYNLYYFIFYLVFWTFLVSRHWSLHSVWDMDLVFGVIITIDRCR